MESFFATLKKEKIYQIAAYKLPREQVKTIIFRYIFIYYNRVRVYTRNPLGLPPVKYREWMRVPGVFGCISPLRGRSAGSLTGADFCRLQFFEGRSILGVVVFQPQTAHLKPQSKVHLGGRFRSLG